MTANIEVIIGTYEEFLLGYKLEQENDKPKLVQSFADKSHAGSLKCLTVQSQWIATGGTDDRIFIYDMLFRKQSQILLTHEGTINALAFTPDNTHLLSAGDDGRFIVTRTKTWVTEANWTKAHKGAAVTQICCHPSGKLALSLGTDLVLRTWNLVKGRVAYKTNLKNRKSLGASPDGLSWSTTGNYFTLCGPRVVEIWAIKGAEVVKSQKTNSKPICNCWISDETCLVGLEDGKIMWVILESGDEPATSTEAHSSRVKAMTYYGGHLVTASSAGELKIWEADETNKLLKELASTNIGCRPTCIGVLDLDQFGQDYVTKNKANNDSTVPKVVKKPEKRERGVVTIEYDDEDKVATESSSASEDDDAKPEEQGKAIIAEDDKEDSEEEASSSSNESAGEEPQIRMPKSRKRRQQMLNMQKQAKQGKLASSKARQNPKKLIN